MRRLVMLVIALAGLSACAPRGAALPPVPEVAPAEPHVLTVVENRNFYDFDVFVLTTGGGQIQKLGTVAGLSKTTFMLIGAYAAGGQAVRFYARSRMSGQQFNSPEITIYEGYGLRWILDDRPGIEWLSSYKLRSEAH